MSRTLLELMLSRIKNHNFTVQYWDGTHVSYGSGTPDFHIIFHREPAAASEKDFSIYLGEAYMRGDLDLDGSFEAMAKALNEGLEQESGVGKLARGILAKALTGLVPSQELARQQKDVQAHYDLGNEFFEIWLDKEMNYSCAYFKTPEDSLEQAQEQKIDLTLRKLNLKPGMRLLDIGCGWGALAVRAAQRHGVRVTAITLSREQFDAASRRVQKEGLEASVSVRLQNFLDLDQTEHFERIVSVGMFEHLGQEHLHRYFETARALLMPGGLSLLHTLTKQTEAPTNAWIRKYIFPGGYIPALREIVNLLPESDLRLTQTESLRRHYVKTLEIWHERFFRPEALEKIHALFDEQFARMWSLYLRMSAAYLRSGGLDLHQIVFTRGVNNALPMTLHDVYRD